MRFSIITPVLNGMPWLPECVRSVDLQRRDVEVEHVVLDAGSTDGTREWLRAHAPEGTVLVFEPDDGQTDALIRGFARATGEVFSWLNGDDVLEPEALARVAAVLAVRPTAAAVSGAALQIAHDGRIIGAIPVLEDMSLQGLLRSPTNLAQPATFFRKDAYERCGGLDRDLDLAMDVDLWLKLARVGEIVPLRDALLARFRLHPNAKSIAGGARAAREDLAVRLRHGMPLRSGPTRLLARLGYVEPVLDALGRRTARRVRDRLWAEPVRGDDDEPDAEPPPVAASTAGPDVTVVVPMHDAARTLRQTLDSLLEQDGVSLQVVVVDDRSADDGPRIAREHPLVDVVVPSRAPGPSAARNTALSLARGEHVVFLDSDDLLLPGALRRRVQAAREARSSAVVLGRPEDLWDETGERRPTEFAIDLGDDPRRTLLEGNRFPPVCALVPRALLASLQAPFDEDVWHGEDWGLWLKLAMRGASFRVLPDVDCVYRRRAGSLSTDRRRACDDAVVILERAARFIDAAPPRDRAALERARRRALHGWLRHRARRRAGEGDVGAAASDLLRALRADPVQGATLPLRAARRAVLPGQD